MATAYDYYDDDDGYTYDDYIPKTHDPGHWMLVGVGLYSLLCLIALPFLVVCGNRRETRRLNIKEWEKIQMDQKEVDDNSIDTKADVDHPESIIIESDGNEIDRDVLKDNDTKKCNESKNHLTNQSSFSPKSIIDTNTVELSPTDSNHRRCKDSKSFQRVSEQEHIHESLHNTNHDEECKRFFDDEEGKAGSLFLSSNASMTDSMVDARSLDGEDSVS